MAKSKGKMPKYPEKPKIGRPIELNEEIIETIKAALLIGNYFETACALAGVHKNSGYDWLKRGHKEPDTLFATFLGAVEWAQAEAENRDIKQLEVWSKENWQVTAWRLERRHPKRWGRREHLEHTGKDGGAISFSDVMKTLMTPVPDEDEENDS